MLPLTRLPRDSSNPSKNSSSTPPSSIYSKSTTPRSPHPLHPTISSTLPPLLLRFTTCCGCCSPHNGIYPSFPITPRLFSFSSSSSVTSSTSRLWKPHYNNNYSTTTSNSSNGGGGGDSNSSDLLLDKVIFHKEADTILEDFAHKVEESLESVLDEEDFDANYSDGILTLKLGKYGVYVLNKQTPNRQIWFSSPVSGPKRYNFDRGSGEWVNTRDGHELRQFLAREISQLVQVPVDLSKR